MKTFIIFLGLFITFAASAQKTLKADSVYLTGKISNVDAAQANSINVVINDLAFGRQIQYPGKINSDGTYRLAFLKTGAQDITLEFNNSVAPVLVKPGDHLQVDFDAGQLISRWFLMAMKLRLTKICWFIMSKDLPMRS